MVKKTYGKTYKKYNNKKNSTNKKTTSNLEFTNKIKEIDDNINSLNSTTRIRVDKDRLNDVDSLDTSFLEGRVSTKKTKKIISKDNTSNVKLTNKKNRKKNSRINMGHPKKKIDFNFVLSIFIIVVVCVFVIFGIFSCINLINQKGNSKSKTNVTEKVKSTKENTNNVKKNTVSEETVIDENILFLGDSFTDNYNVKDIFSDYNIVKSSGDDYTTGNILNNMNNYVYKYNPSKVFISIGSLDIKDDVNMDDTINNIKDIISDIKDNRPLASIYVESIYPINDSDDEKIDKDEIDNLDNDKIKDYNSKIKILCNDLDVKYINVYKELIDKDNKLNIDYTDNGYDLNDEGYKVVTNTLEKYM